MYYFVNLAIRISRNLSYNNLHNINILLHYFVFILFTKAIARMFIVIFVRENFRHSICPSNWRLTSIITRRCLRGCEPCQFPVVVLGSTPRALRARRNTAVEFSINNVTDKVQRKTGGHSHTHDTHHRSANHCHL